MQNHGGYWWGYNKHNVEVLNENMSYENMGAMQTYANLLKESDEALAEMISYFSKTEEPTYIVFFGDHLPAMGNVYEELSFVGAGSEKSNEDILNLHKTPFFIWSNTENVEAEDLGNINAYKLGAIVMEYAGVNTDPYFAYLSNMTVNGTKGLFETENGIKELEDLPEHMKKELSERWLIQYDRMFGKGYAAQP